VSGLGQKSANTSEIQTPNSRHFIIGKRMSIARSHVCGAVPQQMFSGNQTDAGSHETSCKPSLNELFRGV
jgi:hypothetical protein